MRTGGYRFGVVTGIFLAGALLVGPPASTPQRPPDSTEQFERARRLREEAARREQSLQAGLARTRRQEAVGQLHEDLTEIRKCLDALEEKLAGVDTDTELSLDLRRQSQQVEKLAKRIHANVKRL